MKKGMKKGRTEGMEKLVLSMLKNGNQSQLDFQMHRLVRKKN